MKTSFAITSLSLGLLGLGLGCQAERPAEASHSETKPLVTASLPAGSEIQNCVESPPGPSLCDWMSSLDALYFGDITKVEMVTSHAVLASGVGGEVESCPSGIYSEAMEITIAIVDTVVGSPATSVTFRLGVHQLDELSPRPVQHPTAGLVWGSGRERGLVVGDRIGVPLHQASDGMWGLLGEPFVTQQSDGRTDVQARSRCQEPAPVGLQGALPQDLRTEAASCTPTQEAEFRKSVFGDAWADRKTWAFAALCFEMEPVSSGCVTNTDCPVDTPECSAGVCR